MAWIMYQNTEILPFRVRIARTEDAYERALSVRNSAFERHRPSKLKSLLSLETDDLAKGAILLIAESKVSGEPIGALRVSSNRFEPLAIWDGLIAPKEFDQSPSLLISRLTVKSGSVGRLARNTLCKAMYLYAVSTQVKFIFVQAVPPRDRLFRPMGFSPVFDDDPLIKMGANKDVEMRILFAKVFEFESNWRDRKHPLYSFVFDKYHQDIELFQSVTGPTNVRRAGDFDLNRLPTLTQAKFEIPLV